MAFDGDMAGGSAGCNDYTAGYEAADPSLTFGPAAATTQLCPDPEGIMEQEGLFLSDLEMVATYEVTAEGNLEMFDEAGTRLLQFQPE
jgi:heat shock protein HslJ